MSDLLSKINILIRKFDLILISLHMEIFVNTCNCYLCMNEICYSRSMFYIKDEAVIGANIFWVRFSYIENQGDTS